MLIETELTLDEVFKIMKTTMLKKGQKKMRNAERIDKIMEDLTNIWKANPDWRFGQLVSNVIGEIMYNKKINDMFFPEDNVWANGLKEYQEKHSIYNYGQNLNVKKED